MFKKLGCSFTLILLTFNCIYAQTSEEVYYKRLFYTCKFWGHVKYYHTEVAKGSVNWDDVLLNSLDAMKEAPDNTAFNEVLKGMLKEVGRMDLGGGNRQVIPDSLNNNTDLSWIQDNIFSDSVSQSLTDIWDKFLPRNHALVNSNSAGNPGFDNDNGLFESSFYPNENRRILALFRYWNIINYFFPYKYIMDQDWDTTLTEFIPGIVKADNALSYNLALREMTTRLNDTHTYFFSTTYREWLGNSYPPFQVRWIEKKWSLQKFFQEYKKSM